MQSISFLNLKFSASNHFLWLYTARFVLDLVGNPEDRFSLDEVHNDTFDGYLVQNLTLFSIHDNTGAVDMCINIY